MLLGGLTFLASLGAGGAVLRTLAIWLIGIGVAIGFLPLVGLLVYAVVEKLRSWLQ